MKDCRRCTYWQGVGEKLDRDDPADAKMIDRSLHDIARQGTGEWTGWAYPWMSLIASRARSENA